MREVFVLDPSGLIGLGLVLDSPGLGLGLEYVGLGLGLGLGPSGLGLGLGPSGLGLVSVSADPVLITSLTDGHALPWVDKIRYLGVTIVCSKVFKCSSDLAKRAFYRSLNAILGRVGRLVSEEVLLQ